MNGRTRFDEAAVRRQMILVHLRENPGAVLEDIRHCLRWTKERTAQTLLRMERKGEVRRAPGGRSAFLGRPCYRYFAVTEITRTGSETINALVQNLGGDGSASVRRAAAAAAASARRNQAPRTVVPATHLLFGGLGA